MKTILVAGGAGFIGALRPPRSGEGMRFVNLDAFTCAGSEAAAAALAGNGRLISLAGR